MLIWFTCKVGLHIFKVHFYFLIDKYRIFLVAISFDLFWFDYKDWCVKSFVQRFYPVYFYMWGLISIFVWKNDTISVVYVRINSLQRCLLCTKNVCRTVKITRSGFNFIVKYSFWYQWILIYNKMQNHNILLFWKYITILSFFEQFLFWINEK